MTLLLADLGSGTITDNIRAVGAMDVEERGWSGSVGQRASGNGDGQP